MVRVVTMRPYHVEPRHSHVAQNGEFWRYVGAIGKIRRNKPQGVPLPLRELHSRLLQESRAYLLLQYDDKLGGELTSLLATLAGARGDIGQRGRAVELSEAGIETLAQQPRAQKQLHVTKEATAQRGVVTGIVSCKQSTRKRGVSGEMRSEGDMGHGRDMGMCTCAGCA